MKKRVFFICIFLIAIGIFFSIPLIEGYLENKIITLIKEEIDKNYSLDLKRIDVDFWGRDFEISGVKLNLSPDSNHMDILQNDTTRQLLLTYFTVPSIKITNFRVLRLYFWNELIIDKVEIVDPDIELILNRTAKRKDKEVVASKVRYSIAANLPEIHLKKLAIENFQVNLQRYAGDIVKPFFTSGISLAIENFSINKTNSKPKPAVDKVHFSLKDNTFIMPNGLYRLDIQDVNGYYPEDKISVAGLSLQPQHSLYEFAKKAGKQIDRFDVTTDSIRVLKINWEKLLDEEVITIHKIEIKGIKSTSFRDKRYPANKTIKKLPNQLVRDLSFPLTIDTIRMQQAFITHMETAPKGDKPGKLIFNEIRGYIANLTNDDSLLQKNPFMTIDAAAKFMEGTPVKIRYQGEVLHPQNKFTINASTGRMKTTALNRFIEDVAFLRAEEGEILSCNMHMNGTEYIMTGKLNMQYQNLKIKLLDSDTQKDKNLTSFFVNMLIKNENIEGKSYRQGTIYFERNRYKSIFNYFAKSLLSGIPEVVGIEESKTKKKTPF